MTKKVIQNFKRTPNCTSWPKELSQKCFSRNIQYRTRPKGPPFSFFRHCEIFFGQKTSPKGPPFSFFRHCRTFFGKTIFPKGSSFNFFGVLRQMDVENPKGSSLSVSFRHCETFFKNFFGCCRREYFDTLKSFYFFEL